LATILQRDVRDLTNIEGLTQMPRLLTLLAARTAGLLNISDISRTIDIPFTTLHRYLTLLETIYLIKTLPVWSANIGTRMTKTPKILLTDTGLAGYLLGASEERLARNGALRGSLWETFAAMEILKEIGWSKTRPELYHWRTTNRDQVDLLMEARDGRIVGVEVKATATPDSGDFKGLRTLKAVLGDRFHRGVVLHGGTNLTPFAPDLFAVPIERLWR
jgi:predicted AAA+ superfamily ATPase